MGGGRVQGEEGGEGDGVTGGIAGGEEISPMQDGRKKQTREDRATQPINGC